MAEEKIQGPSGPHGLQVDVNLLEQAERELQEREDFGNVSAPGTAPALEDEPAE
jgi:hypothetical protein